jgi:VanZ like protein
VTTFPLATRRTALLLIAAAVGAILIATLFPSGSELAPGWTTAIVGGDDALAGVVQNVLLFMPLGVGLALGGMRGVRLAAVGTLLSFSVEFAQQWIPGRDPSLGDVCFNTLGTALGGLLGSTTHLWLTPAPRRAAWLSLGAALVVAGIALTTGWLFQPDIPATAYVVTLRPDLANRGRYPGSVLHLSPNSRPPLPLGVVAVAGAKPQRLSPLVAVTDERGREVVVLSADHADLALWLRTRGTAWRLDRPDVRARGALAAVAPGDTFTVTAWREAGGATFCLALDSQQWCDRAYTLADGWKLIFDLGYARPWLLDLVAAIWIGGLLVPVGLWARRHWGSAAALVVVLGSLFATPALTGLAPTPLPALLGALAGIGLGLLLQLLPPRDASLDVFLKPELGRLVPPRA